MWIQIFIWMRIRIQGLKNHKDPCGPGSTTLQFGNLYDGKSRVPGPRKAVVEERTPWLAGQPCLFRSCLQIKHLKSIIQNKSFDMQINHSKAIIQSKHRIIMKIYDWNCSAKVGSVARTILEENYQGITKRCRLSWLTNSIFVYGGRGWGLRGLSQWLQLNRGAQINSGDLTPYLTYENYEAQQILQFTTWTDNLDIFSIFYSLYSRFRYSDMLRPSL